MNSILFLFVICLRSSVDSSPTPREDKTLKPSCGYESCPPVKKGMLNVHLIPHTHDDVGWLKTVDQYYYGSNTRLAKAGVQYIIDSVIEELLQDKSKRFIYVETAFFWKWWNEQHDKRRHEVRHLVNNGQLEFIGGAWSMNDEADTHYQSTIDQFSWGFRKLDESFGPCGRPRIGWQIDPFGHSRETASIMARLGFDGLFFGRLDYRDKATRLLQKTAEMIWQGSPENLGTAADLFTGVLFNNYGPPPTFCFDVLCDDEPIIDNKKSIAYNADRRVKAFLNYVQLQSQNYVTKNVIITMGGDFTYQDAHMWYKNMDKLIRITNEMQINGSDINLLYSTPSCYLKAVNDENISLTMKSDDFFPYASDPHSYWTGYFTSRPTIKYYERKGNNFLQVCKQLYALTDLGPEDRVDLDSLRSAMGVMQHHDAITGTEKQHVANDYARILSEAIRECEIVTNTALSKLMEKQPKPGKTITKGTNQLLSLTSCPLLNISQCEIPENFDSFVVTLYNPLSYPVSKYVRIPVTEANPNYSVRCPMGKEHVSQIVPLPLSVQNIPGRFSQAKFELIFKANNLPSLGFRSYYISKSKSGKAFISQSSHKVKMGFANESSNDIRYTINKNKGSSILSVSGTNIDLQVQFYYYEGASGNNEIFKNRSSGAYIFRPNGTNPVKIGDSVVRKMYKGPLCIETHETFSDWVSQVTRLYIDENYLETNWLVGPIPIDDGIGKEVIVRYSTNLKSEGIFYTDSNGREMLKRIRNQRPTYNITLEEPISANYYPVTSKISIKDDQNKFSVLTDRAEGGSSINDGEIELMVHRRLLHDDAFGVGEALNETAFGQGLVARGTHYLVANQNSVEKLVALENILDLWIFFTPTPAISFDQWRETYNMEYSGLSAALPQNIHILTLEPWKGRSLLIRLEHIFEVNEDPKLSQPATVDLEKMFYPFNITSVQETTLGANLPLKDLNRLKWKSESNSVHDLLTEHFTPIQQNSTKVTLHPMEIRTFIVEVQY